MCLGNLRQSSVIIEFFQTEYDKRKTETNQVPVFTRDFLGNVFEGDVDVLTFIPLVKTKRP